MPRYASYPTTDRFVEAFDGIAYGTWLERRALTGFGPIGLYVHLPFCRTQCHFCACSHVVGRSYDRARRYLEHLEAESAMVCKRLGGRVRVAHMHWGGGTPTYYQMPEIERLMRSLRSHFIFAEGGEFSIEVDPRTVDEETISGLATLGFNRLSMGVQDFDPDVQQAIHRAQPEAVVRRALEAARRSGFASVGFDLVVGLPRQTAAGFARTMERVIDAAPSRLALHAYEHRPTRFKAQRNIRSVELPSPGEQAAIFAQAGQRLREAGYLQIGIDHFALPVDDLGAAQRTGNLHRCFTGYSPRPETDLIGLGASAISRVGPIYCQNQRTLPEYQDAIEQGQLPVMRGIELTKDDLARRAVIMALMCHGRVSIESIEIAHLLRFRRYFAPELERLGLASPLARSASTTSGWWSRRRAGPTCARSAPSSIVTSRCARPRK
ncbi:MAG: oxygen-independent coproporphyrinogen III oxidase [Burkholderiaceae bacterium]